MVNQTPVRPTDREKVYDVIDGERDYQGATHPASPHPDLVYHANLLIEYTDKLAADVAAGVGSSPSGGPLKRLRQVAALAVQAMEAHGVQPRENHVPASAGVTGTAHIVSKPDSTKPTVVGSAAHAAPGALVVRMLKR